MTFAIGSLPTMSSLDFEQYWEILNQAAHTLLTLPPGDYPPISYEQTYSAVYKCVCNGYAEDLYRKLVNALSERLHLAANQLKVSNVDDFLQLFNTTYVQYSNGLTCIVPIFNYLARFYVEAKLNLSLKTELTNLFDRIILEQFLDRILAHLSCPPKHLSPAVIENVVRAVHDLRPACAANNASIFQKFIPLLNNVTQDQLPDLQAEVKDMIAQAELDVNIDDAQVGVQRGIKRERAELYDLGDPKHFKQ